MLALTVGSNCFLSPSPDREGCDLTLKVLDPCLESFFTEGTTVKNLEGFVPNTVRSAKYAYLRLI